MKNEYKYVRVEHYQSETTNEKNACFVVTGIILNVWLTSPVNSDSEVCVEMKLYGRFLFLSGKSTCFLKSCK